MDVVETQLNDGKENEGGGGLDSWCYKDGERWSVAHM